MVVILIWLIGRRERPLLLKLDVWSRLRNRVIVAALILSGVYSIILGIIIYWYFTLHSNLYGLQFPFQCCHWTRLFGFVVCICHVIRLFSAVVFISGLIVLFLVLKYYTQKRQSVVDIEIRSQRQLVITLVPVFAIAALLGAAYSAQKYQNLNIIVQNQILDRVMEVMDSSKVEVHFTADAKMSNNRLPAQDCVGFYHVLVNAGVYKSGQIHSFPNWEHWIPACCRNIGKNLAIPDAEKTDQVAREIQGCQFVLTFYIWGWMERGYTIVTSYSFSSAFVIGKFLRKICCVKDAA